MTSIPEKFDGNYYDEQWLGGFFDAEGYVGLRPCVNKHYVVGYTVIPTCQINQSYIAGYFDGEGCIASTVFKAPNNRRIFPFECQPQTRISSCDFDVLDKIHQYLSQKGIDSKVYLRSRKEANIKPQKQLIVYGLDNVENFLVLIYPFLHSVKKAQATIMMRHILPLMKGRKHLTKNGFIELMEYVDQLNITKGGAKRSKYNANYFRAIWRQR